MQFLGFYAMYRIACNIYNCIQYIRLHAIYAILCNIYHVMQHIPLNAICSTLLNNYRVPWCDIFVSPCISDIKLPRHNYLHYVITAIITSTQNHPSPPSFPRCSRWSGSRCCMASYGLWVAVPGPLLGHQDQVGTGDQGQTQQAVRLLLGVWDCNITNETIEISNPNRHKRDK